MRAPGSNRALMRLPCRELRIALIGRSSAIMLGRPSMLDGAMIRVRPAREADLDRLAQFWYERAALTPLPRGVTLRPDARAHWRVSAEGWLTAPDWCVLVAEADDALAGFGVGRIVDGPPGFSPDQLGEIAAFALDGHAYHPGAGRAIVDGLQSWFRGRGVTRVRVTISKHSPVEQAFWRALHGEEWDETLWWTW